MRLWRRLTVVAIVLFAGTAAGGWMLSRTVQIVEPFDPIKREMTGQYGMPLGEPEKVLLWTRRALVPEEAGTDMPLYDRSIAYPVQMRTFWFFYLRSAATAAALLSVGGLIVVVRRRRSSVGVGENPRSGSQ